MDVISTPIVKDLDQVEPLEVEATKKPLPKLDILELVNS